jgi:hypothetical protein
MGFKDRIAKFVYQRLFRNQVEQTVNQKLNKFNSFFTKDQLFHDVANFTVYNQIPGDYFEFGVYEGDSFSKIYKSIWYQWETYKEHAKNFNHDYDEEFFIKKRFFAFDSFKGLPSVNNEDTPKHFNRQGIYSASRERFIAKLQSNKIKLSQVIIVPGWFNSTLTEKIFKKYELRKACVIYIDCDLYESTVSVLNFITKLIQNGTIIIIDDFYRYKGDPSKGIQKAFKEWKSHHPSIGTNELTRCSANRIAFHCFFKK